MLLFLFRISKFDLFLITFCLLFTLEEEEEKKITCQFISNIIIEF